MCMFGAIRQRTVVTPKRDLVHLAQLPADPAGIMSRAHGGQGRVAHRANRGGVAQEGLRCLHQAGHHDLVRLS